MLEVREHPTGFEQIENFAIQLALSLVLEVVDGKRRDDGVEAPERGQRLGEVVLDELDAPVVGESLARHLQHGLREIEAHAEHLATVDPEEGEQPPVARPEVEDAPGLAGHLLEQDALSLRAVRISVGPGEVAQRVFRGCPLLGGHARIIAAQRCAILGRVWRLNSASALRRQVGHDEGQRYGNFVGNR